MSDKKTTEKKDDLTIRLDILDLAVVNIRSEIKQLSDNFVVLRNRMNNVLMKFEEFEKQKKETRKAKRGKK
jgi:hypothetical protein